MKPLKAWTKQEWSSAVTVLALFFGIPLLSWMSGLWPKKVTPVESPAPVVENYEPRRMTLTGTLVCLPHVEGYPPTKECAIGLRTDDGTYYAFDTMLMSSTAEPYKAGDRVTGNGVMTPIER